MRSAWLPTRWFDPTSRRPRFVAPHANRWYRPVFEGLEDRINPAGSITLNGSVLSVVGDPAGNNSFVFSETSSISGGVLHTTYHVNLNGSAQDFTDAQVTQINV